MKLSDEKLVRTCYAAIEETGSEPAETADDILAAIALGEKVALAVVAGLRAVAEAAVQAEREGAEPVVEFMGRRGTPEGTSECWGFLLCDTMNDPVKGSKLYLHSPQASAPVPEGHVIVPYSLTAENGAKLAMIGEYSCQHCDASINWTTIKQIWKDGIRHTKKDGKKNG